MAHFCYRPDIDGLRAIAVVSVLFYHFEVPGFSGGFTGVDVFFVISGFLITQLIVGEIEATGGFDLKRFYIRRARRLLPALYVTLVATLAAGWAWLTPELFQDAAWSVLAAALSASNILFSFEAADYFGRASYLKPALHSWSLGVEEQFYLVWPLLIMTLWRRLARLHLLVVLLGLAFVSLCAAELWSERTSAFFLVPFRVYEFAIGAALVWLPTRLSTSLREGMTLAGLALIVIATLQFDDRVHFPGLSALIPCCGAALVIAAGDAKYSGLLLRNPLCVGLGLISYSLYLVHWPLFVFTRLNAAEMDAAMHVWLLAASVALATVSYFCVERPFRRRHLRLRTLAAAGFAAFAAVALPATAIALSGGVVSRYPSELALALDPKLAEKARVLTWRALRQAHEHEFEDTSKIKVFLIGDSQAGDFMNLLAASELAPHLDIATFPSTVKCQTLFAMATSQAAKEKKVCGTASSRLEADKRIAKADVVVLSFAWSRTGLPPLLENVARLRQLGAKRIVVVGRKDQVAPGQEILAKVRSFDAAETFAARYPHADAWSVNRELAGMAGPFEFFDIMRAFCPDTARCHVVDDRKHPIFFDPRHIAVTEFVANLVFDEARARVLSPEGWSRRPPTQHRSDRTNKK